MRQYTFLDRLFIQVDHALQTLIKVHPVSTHPSPIENIPEAELTERERKQAAALMRVNHVGEVCAQALYQGQALTARQSAVSEKMQAASLEEQDHLAWCRQRIQELGGRASYLNPIWYAGAWTIGAAAGAIGDRWSLGFVAETEKQVVCHLQGHLNRLTPHDNKTRALLEKMASDEAKHEKEALNAGAAVLPLPIRFIMQGVSRVMTTVAYWI